MNQEDVQTSRGDNVAKPDRAPRTLTEASLTVALIRPRRDAPLQAWLAYHEQSAAWYAEIAEIDRGHHHEALYMAGQEREHAKRIVAQIRAGMSVGGEDCGEDRDTAPAGDADAGS